MRYGLNRERLVPRSTRQVAAAIASVPARLRHRRPPVPPPGLLIRAHRTCDAGWFLASGKAASSVVLGALRDQGIDPNAGLDVLEFGCGVGRVARHLVTQRGFRLSGTDDDARSIAWCQRHLKVGRFSVHSLEPELLYPDSSFDAVYAFSAFTHLAQARQLGWMSELKRVLRPGGYLILSLRGEFYLPHLPEPAREAFRAGSLVVIGEDLDGRNDFATFHPEPYVRIVLARDWDVCRHEPEGASGNQNQDLYVVRKPATRSRKVA